MVDWANFVVLVLGFAVTLWTLRQQKNDVHRSDRLKAYHDYLSAQSRWRDAIRRADELLAAGREDEAHEKLNLARDAAWTALSMMRLIAPQPVVDAAKNLNDAIAGSSPTKKGQRENRSYSEFGVLIRELEKAGRDDLGRKALRPYEPPAE
jgi:hypothetical protein